MKINPNDMYVMRVTYRSGKVDQKLIKGKKVVAALARYKGKKSVVAATATKLP